jgi:hypothetical protein
MHRATRKHAVPENALTDRTLNPLQRPHSETKNCVWHLSITGTKPSILYPIVVSVTDIKHSVLSPNVLSVTDTKPSILSPNVLSVTDTLQRTY